MLLSRTSTHTPTPTPRHACPALWGNSFTLRRQLKKKKKIEGSTVEKKGILYVQSILEALSRWRGSLCFAHTNTEETVVIPVYTGPGPCPLKDAPLKVLKKVYTSWTFSVKRLTQIQHPDSWSLHNWLQARFLLTGYIEKKAVQTRGLLPVSHRFPVNPCWQTQLLGETQVPPFWHNPSHIAGSGAEEENHYSPRWTSFNYVIRPAPACGFACRIRANSVTWFITGAHDIVSHD